MLKSAAIQHEDQYQRNMADIIAQHNDQLQAMISRAEETERIFMEYQKRTQKDLSELSRLRAENATLKSKMSIMEVSGTVVADNSLVKFLFCMTLRSFKLAYNNLNQ